MPMEDERAKPAGHSTEVVRAAQELLGALNTVEQAFDTLPADVAREFADQINGSEFDFPVLESRFTRLIGV